MPTVEVNGITLYYEIHGTGAPLLVLGADLTLLAGVTAGLAEGRRVVTFDSRGVGRSAKPDEPCSTAMMAQDTVGLLDALAIGRTPVPGVSMGGRIALQLALTQPARVEKLVLISTSAAGRGKVVVSWPGRLLQVLKKLGLLRSRHPQPRYAHQRQRDASVTYDVVDRLREITAPTLILHGRRDRSVPLSHAERMRAGIMGGRHGRVPGRAHVLPVDAAAAGARSRRGVPGRRNRWSTLVGRVHHG
jgi:3-oxoadipate enol-lactonase